MIDESRLKTYIAEMEAQQPATVAAFEYLVGHRVVFARFADVCRGSLGDKPAII